MSDDQEAFVRIRDLRVEYSDRGGLLGRGRRVAAVDGVSVDVMRGETLGLVGESGCGKSTLGRATMLLTPPSSGSVSFDGEDLSRLSGSRLRAARRRMQMVFQDPYSSLNPRMTARQIIAEPIRAFGIARGREAATKAGELMETVGLSPGLSERYPHEFSGGQRQRIGIARALAAEPEFIVADEPISALDVSIQAQVINLLERLRRERGLTYLFISHDLRAVNRLADRVAVMYLGKIVEIGPAESVYGQPLMPYTKALLASIPVPDPEIEASRPRTIARGDVPSPADPPSGCRFHTRCPFAVEACTRTIPHLTEIRPSHFAACIRIDPGHPDVEVNAAKQTLGPEHEKDPQNAGPASTNKLLEL